MKNNSYLDMELLRFTTAGSVDDGKSTLIGRLLNDSKSIFEDQLESIKISSLNRGFEYVNLALLTDGLRAERDQGITIDVAYRYFATPKRKFIIADTPGHVQYTRNMVTGASTADLAVILLDARKGVLEQTKRHTFIATLLGIPHIVVCINKMDMVDYSQSVFEKIKNDFLAFASKSNTMNIKFIPVSALHGDNVVNKSENMPWYDGTTLMHLLETISVNNDLNYTDCRFPVQCVIRPQSDKYPDYRGYAGRIASGIFKQGDEIMVLPAGLTSKIKTIEGSEGNTNEAFPPMSVTIRLEDELDVSRGDMIVGVNNKPFVDRKLDVVICWMSHIKLVVNKKYILKHITADTTCVIDNIVHKIDINTLDHVYDDNEIGMNDFARISVKSAKLLFFDKYKSNRITGSVIFIDEATNDTVGVGMIL